jgi:hypothetical protein
LALVVQPDGLGLDGDAALALDIHRIEHLLLARHLAIRRPPVIWIRRSASVDLPWSIWATMEKLRIRASGVLAGMVFMRRDIAVRGPEGNGVCSAAAAAKRAAVSAPRGLHGLG